VHADPGALVVGEALEDAVVQRHEVAEHAARGIELDRQAPLGEVDLHAVGAPVERSPDVLLAGVHEVVQERVAPVAVDTVLRVDQAQRGGRDHGLLDRHVRVALCGLQVAIRVTAEPEGSRREPGQLTSVTVRERDHGSVGCQVPEPFERVGGEARLRLLAVRDHG
jgi:hypothetical protein